VQIRHRSFTQPVSADRCDEEEYRESVQQEISMSEALLQEEHAILLLTATEPLTCATSKPTRPDAALMRAWRGESFAIRQRSRSQHASGASGGALP